MMLFQTSRQSAYVTILAMHPHPIPSEFVNQMSCPENQRRAEQTEKSKHISALTGGKLEVYIKKFYQKYSIPFLYFFLRFSILWSEFRNFSSSIWALFCYDM